MATPHPEQPVPIALAPLPDADVDGFAATCGPDSCWIPPARD